jgi:diacylglycerol kinase family enzyme
MRKRLLLVFNPTAGPTGRTLLEHVVREIQRRGGVIVPFEAKAGAARVPAPAEVQAGGYDAVIAAGGDGTVRELAKSLAGSEVAVGFVPMGTGNVLAHEIGLPTSASGLAGVLLNGPTVSVPGARANGEAFYLMAGAGFDGDVVARLNVLWKRRLGKAAYMSPVLGALSGPLPEIDVTLDGRAYKANWVVVTRARHYGGAFVLCPDAKFTGEMLSAVMVRARSRVSLLRRLLTLPVGRLQHEPGVETVPCRLAVIRSVRPVPVQIDGDPFGTTPLEIEAGGVPFRLIVPAERV